MLKLAPAIIITKSSLLTLNSEIFLFVPKVPLTDLSPKMDIQVYITFINILT